MIDVENTQLGAQNWRGQTVRNAAPSDSGNAEPHSNARPGNLSAWKHGLYTHDPEILALRAQDIDALVETTLRLAPWIHESDYGAVRSWAECRKMGDIAGAALQRMGPFRVVKGDLVARKLATEHRLYRQLELAYATSLGLTPAARASLRVDALQGDDLAARAAEMRHGRDH